MSRANGAFRTIAVAALIASLNGCMTGDDNENGKKQSAESGACPEVSGTYIIQDHCQSSFVGKKVVVTQKGCDLSAVWEIALEPWSGAVDKYGKATISGTTGSGGGVQDLVCSGSVKDGVWTMDCPAAGCHVVLASANIDGG